MASPDLKIYSVNRLKGKIRDLGRALEHGEKLPADVRIEKERALAGYRQDLEEAVQRRRKQQMIRKYHMVRFFERKKAQRHLRKIQKRLSNPTGTATERQSLQEDLFNAQVDLNYTLYFPLAEKYQSIYASGLPEGNFTPEGGDRVEQGKQASSSPPRPALWPVIAQCMKEGTLEALRDGKLSTTSRFAIQDTPENLPGAKPHVRTRKGTPGTKDASERTHVRDDDGDESDGAFFDKP